jgi:O-antigen ligase
MSQGYLRYNFHNEFVEVLVHSGFVGCAIFMLAVAALIVLACSAATVEAAFTIAGVLLLCLTESSLEMQHALFLSAFFPLLNCCRHPLRPPVKMQE